MASLLMHPQLHDSCTRGFMTHAVCCLMPGRIRNKEPYTLITLPLHGLLKAKDSCTVHSAADSRGPSIVSQTLTLKRF